MKGQSENRAAPFDRAKHRAMLLEIKAAATQRPAKPVEGTLDDYFTTQRAAAKAHPKTPLNMGLVFDAADQARFYEVGASLVPLMDSAFADGVTPAAVIKFLQLIPMGSLVALDQVFPDAHFAEMVAAILREPVSSLKEGELTAFGDSMSRLLSTIKADEARADHLQRRKMERVLTLALGAILTPETKVLQGASELPLAASPFYGLAVLNIFCFTADLFTSLVGPDAPDRGKEERPSLPAPEPAIAGKPVIEIATSVPAWGGATILTQANDLEWVKDDDGKYRYTRSISRHGGYAHFWITDPGNEEDPRALAFAAGRQMVQTFDPRAATIHWLYSQYSMRLDEPWRDEFVIDGDEALDVLGLAKRTDMTRSEKLILLEKLAAQPSQILVFLYYPESPYSKKFTISRSRLWEIDFDYHYDGDETTPDQLAGLTIHGRSGRWAKSFLNRRGKEEGTAFFEYGHVSLDVLKSIPRHYYRHRGATRLIVYLTNKLRVSPPGQPISVRTVMEEAYGKESVREASLNHKLRGRLADVYEGDLAILKREGWVLDFDSGRYPEDIRPEFVAPRPAKGDKRPKGYWERMLAATLVVYPPEAMALKLADCSGRRTQQRRRAPKRVAASKRDRHGATRL